VAAQARRQLALGAVSACRGRWTSFSFKAFARSERSWARSSELTRVNSGKSLRPRADARRRSERVRGETPRAKAGRLRGRLTRFQRRWQGEFTRVNSEDRDPSGPGLQKREAAGDRLKAPGVTVFGLHPESQILNARKVSGSEGFGAHRNWAGPSRENWATL
jgi:hypothetical protein